MEATDIDCDSFTTNLSPTLDGTALSEGTLELNLGTTISLETYPPGDYYVAVKAAVDGVDEVDDTTTKTLRFDFKLTDPCDPPTKFEIDTSTEASYDYVITADTLKIANTTFTIEPSICPFEVLSVIDSLEGEPITSSNLISSDFEVSYSSDLDIVGQSQKVDIVAKSYSPWEANEDNRIELNDEFTVNYLSPCDNTDYTTITPTDQTQPGPSAFDGVE